jgi:hypothetical protein
MKNRKRSSYLNLGFIIVLVVSFALLGGCNKESSVEPGSTTYNTSVGAYAEGSITDNNIALTSVKFLLRKIELESGETEGDEEEVNLGPLVVDLGLFSKVSEFTFAKLVPGVYDEIHFQLHKPSPTENISDPEFTESTDKRYSVIVKGFYNGEPFVYKTDVTVSKEVEFENHPVAITAEGTVNITIRISPYSWFMRDGQILNPMNPASKRYIDDNIRDSFRRAFKDDNEDGEPD